MKTKLLTLTALACLFVATASNAQVPSYVPANGLVGWWPFNGNANDESNNGHDGTVNGVTLTSDRFGTSNSCYQFSASSFISTNLTGISGSSSLDYPFTISVWVRPDSSGLNSFHSIISKNIDGTDNRYAEFNMQINNNNKLDFFFGSGTSGVYALSYWPTLDILHNGWTHFVFSYSTSKVKFYSNGILVDSSFVGSRYIGNNPVIIGRYINNNASYPSGMFFEGKLDDIGIWNRALTQQEITALYTSCIKPEPVTLGTSATTERCPNDQVTIKVVTPAADPSLTYQWTRNGTNMVGATTRNITVADAAKYKVFVRSGPGVDCQRVSGLVETTAATPPTITATTPNGNAYCAGDSVLMSATGATAGYSYQWKRFGVPIAGATSPDFRATQTGNYRCEVSNAGGCINQSNLISIVNGTSCRIMQDQSSDMSVYPNPAKNSFTVSFNDIGNEIPVSIELRNLQGQSVETRKLNGIAAVQFNISKLSPGVYMIRVMLESGDVVEKSVVVE